MLRRSLYDFVSLAPEGAVGGEAAPSPAPAVVADTATTDNGGGVSNGSGAAVDSGLWLTALDEDTRKTAEAKGWKSPADPAKAYVSLYQDYSKKTANAIALPAADAPPEAWNEIYTKLGRPETPEGYEYSLPKDVPPDLPYDQTLAVNSKQWAHEAGLSPKQAQVLHDKFAVFQAQNYQQHFQAVEDRAAKAHETLTKAWGPEGSEDYKRNHELANRALRNMGGEELISELKTVGALDANGRVLAPKLAATLAKIGGELYAEDAVYGGPTSGENPFAEKTESLDKQGKLIRENPKLAAALMRQAGVSPALYGMRDDGAKL